MPTDDEVTRKLRAILSADVKVYSLLKPDDESFQMHDTEEKRRR